MRHNASRHPTDREEEATMPKGRARRTGEPVGGGEKPRANTGAGGQSDKPVATPAARSERAVPRLPARPLRQPEAQATAEGNGALKEYTGEQLRGVPQGKEVKHAVKCPHDGHRFIYVQKGPLLEKLTCPACFHEYDLERFLSESQKQDVVFGPWHVCDNTVNGKPCGTRFQTKFAGSGGADPERGTGGQDRPCPKCGASPPGSRRVRLAPGMPAQAGGAEKDFDASSLARR